jgi:8-oxo-dGTP pyrophosphatase MutT (NUDIX family)
MSDFIQRLESSLRAPLPGQEAQYRMAHPVRRHVPPIPADVAEAGVLALFFPKAKEWNLALILRQNRNPNDRHGGQISFPGGRREATDRDLRDTALREAEEEVGIDSQKVQLLGELTELYIPVSNFRVEPYVGFMDHAPDFVPQESEVAQILEIPFGEFLNVHNRRQKDFSINPQMTIRDMPYFDVAGHVVWGATAMMISELLVAFERMNE